MAVHRFTKMHGLGNDFVVLDGRWAALVLSADQVRGLADRHTGIGCDQLILLEASETADARMRIYNADGGEAEACGNAARCVASTLMEEKEADTALIETSIGVHEAHDAGEGRVSVDMGAPGLDWDEIPLAEACETLHVGFAHGSLSDPVATNMGNPHVTFFVLDIAAVPLEEFGPAIETAAMFPERINVGVGQITGPASLRFRVWERGVGITRACGTGACAAAVAASRRGLTGRRVAVTLDGGVLDIDWRVDDHVWMTGDVATSFRGETDSLLP
ncbi:MAG: diaminopimelate epimerase [Alphaproteobacteria bacterium]|jgi:diaminopimelate epimerase|nr:diaminopimelate epimerase [Alphaproteobacteria bacterium]MDP6239067.1 diaminopimelate epimerase [Alphaproteobacteria bacterium]MDP7174488.1 diaminopimelate epimerase [Alphaproteobacteria bacterium]MDP7233967.1 diaminopimelate epimerase [Alphaproteobacteria bacterium]MDP7488529.1 diaminopimelate epimerase [Alphaproteobacteria bacterium]|tara:strand:- start:3904 stop:4728 length:825 start_codon:yes stop_codon:yes gene_type:complete